MTPRPLASASATQRPSKLPKPPLPQPPFVCTLSLLPLPAVHQPRCMHPLPPHPCNKHMGQNGDNALPTRLVKVEGGHSFGPRIHGDHARQSAVSAVSAAPVPAAERSHKPWPWVRHLLAIHLVDIRARGWRRAAPQSSMLCSLRLQFLSVQAPRLWVRI